MCNLHAAPQGVRTHMQFLNCSKVSMCNSHAVPCCKISMYNPLAGQIFHPFSHLHAHVQQLHLNVKLNTMICMLRIIIIIIINALENGNKNFNQ